jgi:hypothetical protein
VQLDNELDQVCVRLLPERFLAFAEQIVQQGRDVVGECVGVQIVVQRVIPAVPMAPKIAMPVNNPRSGTLTQ